MKEKRDFRTLTDEQLVTLSRTGSEDAGNELIGRYRSVVKTQASMYYMEGADREDLVQEGMIGFFRAIQNYDEEKGASFATFAAMCVKRQMISAVKSASRHKHEPLNRSVSLSGTFPEKYGGKVSLEETLENTRSDDPEKSVLIAEEMDMLEKNIRELFSDLERQVLSLRIEGRSYDEIAEKLDCTNKAVDNAIRRAKNKLSKYI